MLPDPAVSRLVDAICALLAAPMTMGWGFFGVLTGVRWGVAFLAGALRGGADQSAFGAPACYIIAVLHEQCVQVMD